MPSLGTDKNRRHKGGPADQLVGLR